MFFVSMSLSGCNKIQSDNQVSEQSQWVNSLNLTAVDGSFCASIDCLPQKEYDGIYRLTITPLHHGVLDTIYQIRGIELNRTRCYYGSLSIQGSMGVRWYEFICNEDFCDGVYTFNDFDMELTFVNGYNGDIVDIPMSSQKHGL